MTGPHWLDDGAIPLELADLLLAGTAGRDHLRHAARLAADALPRLRFGLLAAALEEDSLFGPAAGEALTAAEALPQTDRLAAAPFLGLAHELASRFSLPESTAYFTRLEASGEDARARLYLENECQNGRHRLFWLHVALRRAVLVRDFDWGRACLRAALPQDSVPLAALGHKLAGDLALLADEPGQALELYRASEAGVPWPTGLFRAATAAWRCGETGEGVRRLQTIVSRLPEHVTAVLALFDAATGRNTAQAALPGSLGIGLYTYNKAADTDRTLASLFASDLGSATVVVLDNASTDATPQVLAAWRDRVGARRLGIIRLPVNIGAPAARNWLAGDERLTDADFVAYLDDDVDLPADWLGRLGAAVAAYPEAGVWGCRVADAGNVAVAQGVGAVLLPPGAGHPDQDGPRLSDAQATGFDYGAFSHLRPCVSVMGCCHVFRRQRLTDAGGFDIRFSPSQYDDVDHDLRLALSGRPPVYQGHLRVGHRRPAPVFAPPDPVQAACGQANHSKLTAKHHGHLAALAEIMRDVLRQDVRDKWEALAKSDQL